jgi:hypothetical protein
LNDPAWFWGHSSVRHIALQRKNHAGSLFARFIASVRNFGASGRRIVAMTIANQGGVT